MWIKCFEASMRCFFSDTLKCISGLMHLRLFNWNSRKSQLHFVLILEISLLFYKKLPWKRSHWCCCGAAKRFTHTLQSDKPVEPATLCCPLTAPTVVVLSAAPDPPAEGKAGDASEKKSEKSSSCCFKRAGSSISTDFWFVQIAHECK